MFSEKVYAVMFSFTNFTSSGEDTIELLEVFNSKEAAEQFRKEFIENEYSEQKDDWNIKWFDCGTGFDCFAVCANSEIDDDISLSFESWIVEKELK